MSERKRTSAGQDRNRQVVVDNHNNETQACIRTCTQPTCTQPTRTQRTRTQHTAHARTSCFDTQARMMHAGIIRMHARASVQQVRNHHATCGVTAHIPRKDEGTTCKHKGKGNDRGWLNNAVYCDPADGGSSGGSSATISITTRRSSRSRRAHRTHIATSRSVHLEPRENCVTVDMYLGRQMTVAHDEGNTRVPGRTPQSTQRARATTWKTTATKVRKEVSSRLAPRLAPRTATHSNASPPGTSPGAHANSATEGD
jgi:hypothetical protein